MKRWAILAAVLGVILATGVIAWVGFGQVAGAVSRIGWRGFAVLCVYSALPFTLLGLAWYCLSPDTPLNRAWVFIFGRVERDSASELLPFSQLGGFVIGARVTVLRGIAPAMATATTVVDVTAEFIGQLGFVVLGLGLLAARHGTSAHDGALLTLAPIGLLTSAVAAGLFILLQQRGSGLIERGVARWAPQALAQASAVIQALRQLYKRPGRLALAVTLHFAAWIASATGVWLALTLSGAGFSLGAVLAIESLLYALRSVAFAAPMALGVQEAGYAFLGPLFGLSPEMSLAISLLKRGRDLAIGVPALALWQAMEGRQLMVRGGTAAGPASD